jgi:CrcB protein
VLKSIVAISLGASLGAVLRWVLGLKFNAAFTTLPPGTLLANLIGAYIVGVALAAVSVHTSIPQEWRLFVITGFCGGLTTFSSFSAELVLLLQQGRPGWAVAATAAHVIGSVLMTFAGIATMLWIRG